MADSPTETVSDPDAEIMRATYRALREYGYADLTMQRIADEYGKSTAAIHYHYDTKEDLLAAFLDYVLDRFKDTVHEVETTAPEQRLELLLDKLLVDPEDHHDLLVAMLEMRSQAPYKERFSDRFRQNDEYVRYLLRTVIDQGIEEGVFVDVDSDHVSRALMTIVDGARTRAVVLDEAQSLTTARRAADEYVQAELLSPSD
ncbi:TetR family transcriptional regulator C-terminal domain-containing protein [Haloterrigena sp. SYSU A121-1]|uniref:TetR family transcriptional regulator C-terminal domain-containing protein n=1 Tax=Haloterrigena gelatinilytica TaxID=2741724 RepID=A0A8J8GRA3_9EURY|nr:TetR family transcriptional regulator C-terminal domain-containing protein [Haloterrigena gelatinilytica]NUB93720.1 TetR family transcriptional regulator C-terminal domain-containing protein [Haloterrigena gelatinilytica]